MSWPFIRGYTTVALLLFLSACGDETPSSSVNIQQEHKNTNDTGYRKPAAADIQASPAFNEVPIEQLDQNITQHAFKKLHNALPDTKNYKIAAVWRGQTKPNDSWSIALFKDINNPKSNRAIIDIDATTGKITSITGISYPVPSFASEEARTKYITDILGNLVDNISDYELQSTNGPFVFKNRKHPEQKMIVGNAPFLDYIHLE
ncbi:hypothetical protein DFP93_102356 [Aneurinibacillus soli]|uniref:Uncharacterized protein n=1 Tax=Aneurinibacillus soli TaxID=1500254 RepID=A0A0U5B6X9_9BACL|nr:hypothetical protein [Aneurinibacillus soli]PYE63669.1 hypothetical protein DFP93_102356 [Aneurinibacillus soli]BAU27398.1 hypothetical protein CB4_01572 [Aneurinibacillus soli]